MMRLCRIESNGSPPLRGDAPPSPKLARKFVCVYEAAPPPKPGATAGIKSTTRPRRVHQCFLCAPDQTEKKKTEIQGALSSAGVLQAGAKAGAVGRLQAHAGMHALWPMAAISFRPVGPHEHLPKKKTGKEEGGGQHIREGCPSPPLLFS